MYKIKGLNFIKKVKYSTVGKYNKLEIISTDFQINKTQMSKIFLSLMFSNNNKLTKENIIKINSLNLFKKTKTYSNNTNSIIKNPKYKKLYLFKKINRYKKFIITFTNIVLKENENPKEEDKSSEENEEFFKTKQEEKENSEKNIKNNTETNENSKID